MTRPKIKALFLMFFLDGNTPTCMFLKTRARRKRLDSWDTCGIQSPMKSKRPKSLFT